MTSGAALRSPIFSNNGMIRNAVVGTSADDCNVVSAHARRHSQSTVSRSEGQRVMLTIWPPRHSGPNRSTACRNMRNRLSVSWVSGASEFSSTGFNCPIVRTSTA